jgi:hypothetical protein
MFKNTLYLVVMIALIAVLILAGPVLVIWAWNTLFGSMLLIPFTIWTWLAVLILGVFIRSDVKVTKKT